MIQLCVLLTEAHMYLRTQQNQTTGTPEYLTVLISLIKLRTQKLTSDEAPSPTSD